VLPDPNLPQGCGDPPGRGQTGHRNFTQAQSLLTSSLLLRDHADKWRSGIATLADCGVPGSLVVVIQLRLLCSLSPQTNQLTFDLTYPSVLNLHLPCAFQLTPLPSISLTFSSMGKPASPDHWPTGTTQPSHLKPCRFLLFTGLGNNKWGRPKIGQ